MSGLNRICGAAVVVWLVGNGTTTGFGEEILHLGFDDPGDGVTVSDSVSGNDIGALNGEASFGTSDAPCLDSGDANNSYGDFSLGGYAHINQAGFVFHDPTAGGAEGDATLEFLLNSPRQVHASIFWTNGDNNENDERFNMFWNAEFRSPSGANFFGVDFVSSEGGTELHDFATGIDLIPDLWHHVAIVREDVGGAFDYSFYLNGDLVTSGSSGSVMPISQSWLIAGRSNSPSWTGLIDEIIMHDEAVDPNDFNLVCPPICPANGDADFADTHCLEVLVSPEPSFPLPPAGTFTITADGVDDTGDPLIYVFTIQDSFGAERKIVKSTSFLNTILTEGAWTISVTIDDDIQCGDKANDAECSSIDIDVGPPPAFQGEFLIRFEEGTGTDLAETVGGGVGGVLQRGATFTDDAPELSSATPNNFAMDVNNGGALMSSPFIFHDRSAGGAEGDATLEGFIKIPAEGHSHTSIFWTREDTATDVNRFNIYWNAEFTGMPSSQNFIAVDQRDPDGQIGDIGNPRNGHPLPTGYWFSFHITRTLIDTGGNGGANGPLPPSYEWQWYFNGIHSPEHTLTTSLVQPTSLFWQISGRTGFGFSGQIDEIHGIDRVLEPEEMTTILLDCPDEGDTTCSGATISPPPDDPPPAAGAFQVTATGDDDSGDDVLYTYVADNFAGTRLENGPTLNSSTVFFLSEGAWTISVTTDDNVFCPDTAPGNSCEIDIDVGPAEPFTEVLYRFEDGGGTDVVDSISGNVHGQIVDGGTFTSDTADLQAGTQNDFAADFNAGRAVMTSTFVFHSPSVGGASGDATLEWLMKIGGQGHSTIFWTNEDNTSDSNRYNIFWNASPHGGGTDFVNGDANPGGAISEFGFGIPIPLASWNQIAIVRTDTGNGTYAHDWYYNGQLNASQSSTIGQQDLPASNSWGICSRSGGTSARALIDEIRMVDRALETVEMNVSARDCPQDGDTTCDSLQMAGPPNDTAGAFTAFVNATDGNGDPLIIDIFGEVDGGERRTLATGTSGEPLDFVLSPGEWTITAVADDDRFCSDKAPGNTCELTRTVGSAPPFESSWIRFEDDSGISIQGNASISGDTPNANIPATGDSNTGSFDTTLGGFAQVNNQPFVFHDPLFGGAPGDATLEWYFKTLPDGAPHTSFFWTNADGAGDDQRFNIFWNAVFTEAPDSERFVSADFRLNGGTVAIVPDHNTGLALDHDVWHHVAIVRSESGGGADGLLGPSFDWTWYFNGALSEGHSMTTTGFMPTSTRWLIAGRSGNSSFPGFMDEVRMSGCALTTDQFLSGTSAAGCGGGGGGGGGNFRRGDCDQSGKLDFNDAIFHLRFLFLGENEDIVNTCRDACDSDDSGADDFTDDINSLRVLFLGQGDIPEPGPQPDESHPCGPDPTLETPEELTCESYAPTIACP